MAETDRQREVASPHPRLEEAQRELSTAIDELRVLCESVDASALFAAAAIMMSGSDTPLPVDTLDLIPAKLLILLYVASEFFPNVKDSTITEKHLATCVRLLDKAYSAQRALISGPYLTAPGPFAKSFMLGSLAIETSMGVGAAEIEQSRSLIRIVQGKFDKRYQDRLGISPTKAIEVLFAIARVQQSEPRSALFQKSHLIWRKCGTNAHDDDEDLGSFINLGDAPFADSSELRKIPVGRQEVEGICPVSHDEWTAIISLIGCNRSRRAHLQHPLDTINHPLAVFPDDRVFMINFAGCLQQLFEQFDSDAKSDQAFYSSRYQRHISDYLELNAAACFERLFPRESVYRQLIYPDPDRNDGGSAELDLAVFWPPFLIICEAKSKQLRFRPLGADIARFCTDIKSNIEDGFTQARRFSKYIESSNEVVLSEKHGKRSLKLNKSDIREVFPISVSLRRLVSIAGHLPTLKEMGLFRDGRFPWAVALDDLDIITRFCPSPDIFLHFIKRRLMLETEEVRYTGSELDFFGTYLNSGRLEPELWRHAAKRPKLITLTRYHERFQKAIYREEAGVPVLSPVPLCVPSVVKDFLQELSLRTNDTQARWIAFCLLSLTDEQIAGLAFGIETLKSSPATDGRIRSIMLPMKDLVFSLTLSEEHDLKQLYDVTFNRAVAVKYNTKSSQCAAFGIRNCDRSQPFAHAFWFESKWELDPLLEEHARQMKTRAHMVRPPGFKMPGRNDRCPCGSGKKFKHCCLDKYQRPGFTV